MKLEDVGLTRNRQVRVAIGAVAGMLLGGSKEWAMIGAARGADERVGRIVESALRANRRV